MTPAIVVAGLWPTAKVHVLAKIYAQKSPGAMPGLRLCLLETSG